MQTYAKKAKKPEQRKQLQPQQNPLTTIPEHIDLRSSGRNLQLPEVLRERVQSQFGFDPSSISIKESPQVADMGANAMAQGNIISFAPGSYDPNSSSGTELLGHELSHIAEQAKGLKSNIEGSNIHYNTTSESASDTAGRTFASHGMSAALAPSVTPAPASSAPVQGNFITDFFKRKRRPEISSPLPGKGGKIVDNSGLDLPDNPIPLTQEQQLRKEKMLSAGAGSNTAFSTHITNKKKMMENYKKANNEKPAIDARIIQDIVDTVSGGQGMEGDELNDFYKIIGGDNFNEVEPLLNKFYTGHYNNLMSIDENIFDEEYIIKNFKKSLLFTGYGQANTKIQEKWGKQYKINPWQQEIFDDTKDFSANLNQYIGFVLANSNMTGSDIHSRPNKDERTQAIDALTLDGAKKRLINSMPSLINAKEKHKKEFPPPVSSNEITIEENLPVSNPQPQTSVQPGVQSRGNNSSGGGGFWSKFTNMFKRGGSGRQPVKKNTDSLIKENSIGETEDKKQKTEFSENIPKIRKIRNDILGKKSYSDSVFDYEDADYDLLQKNMEGIKRVQSDFGNFKIDEVGISSNTDGGAFFQPGRRSKGEGIGNRIFFNPDTYKKQRRNEISDPGKKDGLYGLLTAGEEYSGIHEAGHAVNAEIMDKLYGLKNRQQRITKGVKKGETGTSSSFWQDYTGNITSSAILSDAVMRAYKENESFKNKMHSQITHDEDDNDFAREMKIYDLTLEDSKNPDMKSEDADIKKSLYKLGYTSEYGMKNSAELFAEAFADYYSTLDKNKKLKEEGKDEVEMNPLTKAIYEIAQELMNSDDKRKSFKQRHLYKN